MAGRNKKPDFVTDAKVITGRVLSTAEKKDKLEVIIALAADWLIDQARARSGSGTGAAMGILVSCQNLLFNISDREAGHDQNVTIKFELPGK
jgi:hypothetical protein